MQNITVGIDLGSTYSSAAFVDEQGWPIVIPNAQGHLFTPSAVLVEAGRIEVGESAFSQWATNGEHVARWFKRAMGDERYRFQGLSAPELSAEVLKELKCDAEVFLGQAVDQAVIACPAYFDVLEIENTRKAGVLAGFEDCQTVKEAVAALYFEGLDNLQDGEKVVVCDLGGGDYQASVLDYTGGALTLLASDGSRTSGGDDWTMDLVDLVAKEYLLLNKEDPRQDPVDFQKLYAACERAKRHFSRLAEVPIVCQCGSHTETFTIQRAEFESRTEERIQKLVIWSTQAVQKAGLEWSEIDTIHLVGGAARLRRVSQALEECAGKQPVLSQEPDLAVALGAAMQAAPFVHAYDRTRRFPAGPPMPTAWALNPPKDAFDTKAGQAGELLAGVIKRNPRLAGEGYDKQLEALQSMASQAYKSQDPAAWQAAFSKLEALYNLLKELPEANEGENLLLDREKDPHMLIQFLAQVLDQLRQNARYMGNYSRFRMDFMDADWRLQRIDPSAPDAMGQIRNWVSNEFEDLRVRVVTPPMPNLMMRNGGGGEGSPWRESTGAGGSVGWLGRSDPKTSRSQEEPAPAWPEVPGAVDRVHFSVSAPPVVAPGSAFVVDLWAHMDQQRQEVIQRARDAAGGKEILVKTKGPLPVARGTVLTVNLKMGDLLIEDAQDTILWEGEIGNASFAVQVPQAAAAGPRVGQATIYANAAQIARLNFELAVGAEPVEAKGLALQEKRHQTAFASYASRDRSEVLRCIQGMEKAAPFLKIFVDVHSLRSGQKWEEELWRRIPASDVFFLFWSTNAMKSAWVEKEWRCALGARGLDFIDPVPLQPPDVAPPPQELADLHFNDWQLAYQRRKRS